MVWWARLLQVQTGWQEVQSSSVGNRLGWLGLVFLTCSSPMQYTTLLLYSPLVGPALQARIGLTASLFVPAVVQYSIPPYSSPTVGIATTHWQTWNLPLLYSLPISMSSFPAAFNSP